jgi:hypothetical protein
MKLKTLHKQHSPLTNDEYITLLNNVSDKLILVSRGPGDREIITKHLTYIASMNVVSLLDPTRQSVDTDLLRNTKDLIIFYKQLDFLVFSSCTEGYPDYFDRLVTNLIMGLQNQLQDDFNYTEWTDNFYELAKSLYKKTWFEHYLKPSEDRVLRYFFRNHRHLVLQLLIMQYYANIQI